MPGAAPPAGGQEGPERDDAGEDDKVICVPLKDPNWNTFTQLDDMPQQLQDEISHFFAIYKTLEKKDVTVEGWRPLEDAWASIEDGRERWAATHPPA